MIKIHYFLITILCFCISYLLNAAMAGPTPPLEVAMSHANHVIQHIFTLNEKSYAVLDDFSLWEFNPENLNNKKNYRYLTNKFVTIMPDTGPADYPVTFIISNKKEIFTTTLVAIPTALTSLVIMEIDPSGFITTSSKDGLQLMAIFPNQHIKGWQKGQKLIIGGIWISELDPKDRTGSFYYPLTLYNYDTNEFVLASHPLASN